MGLEHSQLQLNLIIQYLLGSVIQTCIMKKDKKEEARNESNDSSHQTDRHHLEPLITLSKISSMLVHKLRTQPIPELILPVCNSIGQTANTYYNEYLKHFHENQSLNNQLAEIISDRNMLAEKYNQIKRIKSTEEAVRRKRRYARDIERLFYCPIEKCNRGYGSEGSLSHHVRLKHLQFYLSGRYEIFIQNYIDKMTDNKKKHDGDKSEEIQLEKIQVVDTMKKKKLTAKQKAQLKSENKIKVEQ